MSESFELYDLRVEVISPPGAKIYCGASPGDYFELHGEMLKLPPHQGFSIYSLAAVLPLLAAKQRVLDANDWMTSDAEVACPDPNCPTRLRVTRTGKRRFERSQTTATAKPGTMPRISLTAGYEISRVIKGGWQLAGGHGTIDAQQAVKDMAAFVEAGINTFDCADIYTGVEEMIGRFRSQYPQLAKSLHVHTKFVPDLQALQRVDRSYVEQAIDRSLRRLGVEQLDLVQFHWWDYSAPAYVSTAVELERLRKAGKIANIGVTNFDVPRLQEIVDAGVSVLTHQVQYSLLDTRPENAMVEFCRRNGISLLCYGTVAGGFLSERWLRQPEPVNLENRSLLKYQLIIEELGGWSLFQQLLAALEKIAGKHACDIATVASAVMLKRQAVAAVIVGATNIAHVAANQQIGAIALDAEDEAGIGSILQKGAGPSGDVYSLERDREGRHGRIMKYNLNK